MEAALIFRLSLTFTSNRCYNRSLTDVVPQILWCFYRLWGGRYKRPLASRDFIGLWKEKRCRRNMMFLFAGHSDKPLKSLISMAHKGNHICLYRFSFIYIMDDLWENAYTCLIYAVKRTTESANLRYGTPGYGMSAYKRGRISCFDFMNIVSTIITIT